MRRLVTRAAVSAAILGVLVGAGDQPPVGPRSPAAVAAIAKADRAVEAARKAYDAAVQRARTTEAAELRAAGRAATAKGDADETVAVAAKVKEVEAGTPAAEFPQGKWDVLYLRPVQATTWDIANGVATHDKTEATGKVTRDGSTAVVRWSSGWTDRLTPMADGRFLLESWGPGQSMDQTPPTFATGVRKQ